MTSRCLISCNGSFSSWPRRILVGDRPFDFLFPPAGASIRCLSFSSFGSLGSTELSLFSANDRALLFQDDSYPLRKSFQPPPIFITSLMSSGLFPLLVLRMRPDLQLTSSPSTCEQMDGLSLLRPPIFFDRRRSPAPCVFLFFSEC